MAKRSAQAAARKQRGELDPERAETRLRLREVVARQRDLGLVKAAGTEELIVELLPGAGFAGSGGRGGSNRGRPGEPHCNMMYSCELRRSRRGNQHGLTRGMHAKGPQVDQHFSKSGWP